MAYIIRNVPPGQRLANISTVVIPEDNDDEKKGYESGYPSGCL